MEKLNRIAKLFLFLTATFFVIWLGGYIARHILVYNLFDNELVLRDKFTVENLTPVFHTSYGVIILNAVSFLLFLINFILFLIFSKMKLKNEGWLFIISAIIFITAPFEIYLSIIDYDIIKNILIGSFSNSDILSLFKERIKSLSSFSMIEIFSYFGILYMYIFKPFRKVKNEN
ncbi:MAG: hypothetical protein JXA68_06655 [Ignavibacteriales bacterium]|nr:hypothetical protein [Ignavibacteriales bacterium]